MINTVISDCWLLIKYLSRAVENQEWLGINTWVM